MIRIVCFTLLLFYVISVHCTSNKNVVEIEKSKHYDNRLMSALKKVTPRSPKFVQPAQNGRRRPAQIQRVRTTIRPTVKPKLVSNCAAFDFTNAKTCCKSLPDTIIRNDHLLACNDMKADSDLFAITREYILNWHQDPRTNDRVDLALTKTISQLGAQVCFAVCLFKRTGMMDDLGVMNYSNVAIEMTSDVTDIHWLSVITEAIPNCQIVVEREPIKVISYRGGDCSTEPALLLQCVRKYLITGCPNYLYGQSDACFERMKNLGKCNAFYTDINTVLATTTTTTTVAP